MSLAINDPINYLPLCRHVNKEHILPDNSTTSQAEKNWASKCTTM